MLNTHELKSELLGALNSVRFACDSSRPPVVHQFNERLEWMGDYMIHGVFTLFLKSIGADDSDESEEPIHIALSLPQGYARVDGETKGIPADATFYETLSSALSATEPRYKTLFSSSLQARLAQLASERAEASSSSSSSPPPSSSPS